jgi:hypothetical protein
MHFLRTIGLRRPFGTFDKFRVDCQLLGRGRTGQQIKQQGKITVAG